MNSENNISKLAVLIIDDNPLELGLIRLIIQKNFSDLNCTYMTKPPDWTSFLQTHKFDVIIIDYRLPEKNGIEHIREIRKLNSKIPIFLITALERDEIDQDITLSGVTDLIIKDRNYTNLVSKLNTLILKITFIQLKEKIKFLKKIINSFTNLVVLIIDENEYCLEIIGDIESILNVKYTELLNSDWKIYFGEIFHKLKSKTKSSINGSQDLYEYELEIKNCKKKIKLSFHSSSSFEFLVIHS